MLESSDRGAYIESLELIKELDFDVLVLRAAVGRHRIDAILERLRRGDDH